MIIYVEIALFLFKDKLKCLKFNILKILKILNGILLISLLFIFIDS